MTRMRVRSDTTNGDDSLLNVFTLSFLDPTLIELFPFLAFSTICITLSIDLLICVHCYRTLILSNHLSSYPSKIIAQALE